MSMLCLSSSEQLAIQLVAFDEFASREPALAEALLSCTAFVNRRYAGREESNRVALVPL